MTRIGDGVVRVDVDGRTQIVYVAGPADDRWAFWNGNVYRLRQMSDAPAAGPRRRPHGLRIDVTAPMPALIVAIKVGEGDHVKAGDTIVVVEAMKMELPVRAPGDGRVRAIRCKAGELVQGDAVLVELE